MSSSFSISFSLGLFKNTFLENFCKTELEGSGNNTSAYTSEDIRGEAYFNALNLLIEIGKWQIATLIYDKALERHVWQSTNLVVNTELEIYAQKAKNIIDMIKGRIVLEPTKETFVSSGPKYKSYNKENIPPEILCTMVRKVRKVEIKRPSPYEISARDRCQAGPNKYFHYR